ncbi:MAG: hypothetical protein KBT03_02905 [Bacteroidales bacterium]|nr:hypothetical protein [Candidatus Scybalousia scybalohippi]
MKLRIFRSTSKNGKQYWNIPATNYKNPQDKLTYFVGFSKDAGEPTPNTAIAKSGNNYYYADIDVLEMKFSCFNGSPQLSIFKWVESKEPVIEQVSMANKMAQSQWVEKPKQDNQVVIESDDLPFYGG